MKNILIAELSRWLKGVASLKSNLRLQLIRLGRWVYRRWFRQTAWGQAIAHQLIRRGYVTTKDIEISALSPLKMPLLRISGRAESFADLDDVPGFHLSQPLNFALSDLLVLHPHINIIIPSLNLRHMSGGPNTALLLAAYLADSGEAVRLISCDAPAEREKAELYPHMDGLFRRDVNRRQITLVDGFDRSKPITIGAHDLFFATAWWTAQIAKYGMQRTVHEKFIYLIQDFEPILHPASTLQARAVETYGFPHIPVINTRLLLDHLVKEGTGCYAQSDFVKEALVFQPAIDRTCYFPDFSKQSHVGGRRRHVLLFYARPTIAHRNLFEIGVVALRRAVASGCITKESWEIWTMGERLEPIALGNGVVINSLPWLSFDKYAERVRTADLLLSLMLSPHPSYPPLEMAASGNLVVTNCYSVKTKDRLRTISPNILVAEPTAESVANALENAAGRINVGLPSYDPSGAISLPSNWDQSMLRIVPELLQRIQTLRAAPPEPDVPFALGRPSVPKTEYECYRRACLMRRRCEDEYRQEPGLLSFVTSAYNTDPVFLEELGSSVLLQDGGMHFEWLILDNGSTNECTRHTLQELARHPGVRLERVAHNLGIVGGMRYCLEHAGGRYILPLDSDDLIEPDCIHVLTRFIKDNDYPPLLYTDEDKVSAGRFGSPYFKPDWDPVLFLHSCYIAHLCAIDRQLGLQLDLYSDKTAEGCHDWDSFIRFMNAGHVPRHIPEVLYSWRIHEASTSGNITSKSYITDSHRATLQRALDRHNVPHLELVSSPLFSKDVDWWYRRKRDVTVSCISLAIASARGGTRPALSLQPVALVDADNENGLARLAESLAATQSEHVHLCWNGIAPDDDEWRWDAAGLMEMFTDAVMVGGTLHDGNKIIDGPRIFGFGGGYDCPDRGRSLADCGYSATMWKARSVSAVSSGHCVVRRDFLLDAMPTLLAEKVCLNMLGPWLGAIAAQVGKRVVYSPFMQAKAVIVPEDLAPEIARANFLSRFWAHLPEMRFYSPRLGLTLETAYTPITDIDRNRHLKRLQLDTLPYAEWLDRELQHRAVRYPAPAQAVRVSIVTPVYHGSDLDLLDGLAGAIAAQSVQVSEWLIVVNGPMSKVSVELIRSRSAGGWKARLIIVEPQPIGIVQALRLGLEAAQGEYVLPVDADDLITPDAVQILTHEIDRLARPDLLYTDEDLLVDGRPAMPYLRSIFDPVLALDNSTIWHLCAMKRDAALAADVYGDAAANWCQDWDSVSRIAGSGGRIAHVPLVLYHWRQHAGSTTNNVQGDPRSLDSVRYILERHIAHTATPQRFYVAEWPEHRGARELYIARRPDDLPQFVWIGDAAAEAVQCNENAIFLIAANGVLIESQQVFVEVARLFELHSRVGVVGGRVEGKNGLVVDGCHMVNSAGVLESPWLGQPVNWGGPYALALKTQSVATTGNSLAFFRVSALKQAGVWPLKTNTPASDLVMRLCGRLAADNWTVAFSPLIRARTDSSFRIEPSRRQPPSGVTRVSHGLVRCGMSRNYQD